VSLRYVRVVTGWACARRSGVYSRGESACFTGGWLREGMTATKARAVERGTLQLGGNGGRGGLSLPFNIFSLLFWREANVLSSLKRAKRHIPKVE